jgi:hypothetical protein
MLPLWFGWGALIEFRCRRAALDVRRDLAAAHLNGASPGEVTNYLNLYGIRHDAYAKTTNPPEGKRTILAWTEIDVSGRPNLELGWTVGCVWITFRFDESDQLKGYEVTPGVRGIIDT